MSKLKEMFIELKIEEATIRELANLFLDNPIAVMAKVTELNLPDDTVQKAMSIVMANPNEMVLFAESIGLDEKAVEEAKARLDGMMPK